MTRSLVRLTFALAVLGLAAGCSSGLDRVQASGSASYDGKPIETGTIELTPVDGTKGPVTGGVIHNGQWGIAADKGPLVGGAYLVRIAGMKKIGEKFVDPNFPEEPPVETVTSYIPDVYNAKSTRKITISAKSSKNRFQFDLAPP